MNKQSQYFFAACVYGLIALGLVFGGGCASLTQDFRPTAKKSDILKEPIVLNGDSDSCTPRARVDRVSEDILQVTNTGICPVAFNKVQFRDLTQKELTWFSLGSPQVIKPGSYITLFHPSDAEFAMAVMATTTQVEVHLNGTFN